VKSYSRLRQAARADVAGAFTSLYKNGNIFDRVPFVLGAGIKAIVTQQVDQRIAADMKGSTSTRSLDNSTVSRLVKEGYFEQLFGADVKARAATREAGLLKKAITKHEAHEEETRR